MRLQGSQTRVNSRISGRKVGTKPVLRAVPTGMLFRVLAMRPPQVAASFRSASATLDSHPQRALAHARGRSSPAVSRHRSGRAHPGLPWHSQCPLAGIGRGTECGAWLDAPRFAVRPQVQGRLLWGKELGPSGEYAPTARAIKPNSAANRLTFREQLVGRFVQMPLGALSICQMSNQLAGKPVNVHASEVIEILSLEIEDGRAKDDRYVDAPP